MTGQQKALVTLATLLALSVCANAFLGGILIARPPYPGTIPMERELGAHREGLRGESLRGEGMRAGREGLRDMLRELPPDVREQIGQALRQNSRAMAQGMRSVMEARQATQEVLTASEFKADALRAALKAQRDEQLKVQERVHEQLVGVIETLTPEQRAQLGREARKLFR